MGFNKDNDDDYVDVCCTFLQFYAKCSDASMAAGVKRELITRINVFLKVKAMSLTLHKVTTSQNDVTDDVDAGHVFTFVWDDVARLQMTSSSTVRSIESSEVKYAGHTWTFVCTRKVRFHTLLLMMMVMMMGYHGYRICWWTARKDTMQRFHKETPLSQCYAPRPSNKHRQAG